MLMITVSTEFFTPITQDFYDKSISSLPFHQLTCSCGHSGCLTIHGYYYRSIKSEDSAVRLHICRVKCSICGMTHALLLSSIVPYSQISLPDQIRILSCYELLVNFSSIMEETPYIDENNIHSIIHSYRIQWKVVFFHYTFPLNPPFLLSISAFHILIANSCRLNGHQIFCFSNPHNLIRLCRWHPLYLRKIKEGFHMNKEKTHDIALMRYSIIAPLISGLQDDYSSHEAFFRAASARGVTTPDGPRDTLLLPPSRNGTTIITGAALMLWFHRLVQFSVS